MSRSRTVPTLPGIGSCPDDIHNFVIPAGAYPVWHEYEGKWWWRIVWRGDPSIAVEKAQEAGFKQAVLLDCGGQLLLLRPVGKKRK